MCKKVNSTNTKPRKPEAGGGCEKMNTDHFKG